MASLEQSLAELRAAGFTEVADRDRSDWYLALARRELAEMEDSLKPVMLKAIGSERTAHFIANWRQLTLVLASGELRPAHLKALCPG
jgi:hypothetical protein